MDECELGDAELEGDGCLLERLQFTVPLAKVKISDPNVAHCSGRNSKCSVL